MSVVTKNTDAYYVASKETEAIMAQAWPKTDPTLAGSIKKGRAGSRRLDGFMKRCTVAQIQLIELHKPNMAPEDLKRARRTLKILRRRLSTWKKPTN